MKISQRGREKLKQLEDVRYVAYQDDKGVWTNGVGHTGPDVFKGQVVDDAQVERWLTEDLRVAESVVNRLVRVTLTQHQFDALVLFVFNIGETQFAGSTLLRLLNKGQYESVPSELMKWNKITVNKKKVPNRGLTNRRAKEASLWSSGAAISRLVAEPPAPKPLKQSNTARGLGLSSVGTLGTAATDAAQQVQVLADYSETIRWIFITLLLVGIGLTAYGFINARKREAQ